MKILYYVFALCAVYSCTNDDDGLEQASCLGTLEEFMGDDCQILSSVEYCDTSMLGNLSLTEENKLFLTQYCQPVSDNIILQNGQNESLNFKIIEKKHSRWRTTSDYFGTCGLIAICYTLEEASISISSSEINLALDIKIRNTTERIDPGNDRSGVGLFIEEVIGSSAHAVMSFIIDQGDLTFDAYPNSLFYDSIELNGATYFNVMSSESVDQENQYYYNKELGFIGFLEDDGTTWSLN